MTVCCFCGQELDLVFAATLEVIPPHAEGESQTLYCHGTCLATRLHASIPYHPDLDDA